MSPSAPVTCLRTVRLDASAEYIQQLYNYCNTWVVKIDVMLDLKGKVSQGTGFLVDGERGLLVTNYHVVADRQNVMIQFANRFYESNVIQGKQLSTDLFFILTGRVVYVEPQHDLALIRMNQYVANSLYYLVLSDSDAQPGDECISIGYSDIYSTLNNGFICSMACINELSLGSLTNFSEKCYDSCHTLTIHTCTGNPGSSGCPIINMNGQVIGIHFGAKNSKINSATKATDIFAFIQRGRQYMDNEFIEIQNDRQKRFKRSFSLGVILTEFIVKGFTYNATQARNLLQVNDIIISVNGIQLTNLNQLTVALNNITSDQQVIHLTVRRETRLEASVVCLRTVCMDASVEHIEQIYNNCKQLVVKLTVPKYTGIGVLEGTGVVIDSDRGLVLTNYHVVEDIDDAIVQFYYNFNEQLVIEGKKLSNNNFVNTIAGRVVYIEPQYDLALIRMSQYVANSLSSLVMSDRDAQPGDECILIGYPDIDI
ncbi:probable periplasmic serine endoprotease DegP-like [Oppia nitens]|uniref:probable periplasmic serine endoprotease DegP-like n=1 Tax=Oppia nitens TaxID=1686743 RepID=UPI0023DA0F1D|nr:probable periplasmic serine endoprotease DegP-like [Oppia nitens]